MSDRVTAAVGLAPSEDVVRLRAGGVSDGPRVDREAGLIRGFAVITRGEALGHGGWVDEEFLDEVVAAVPMGATIKSRLTHPGMSSDGIESALGRVRDLYRDGDVVRGTLEIFESAAKSPKGDLREYVLSLAEEAPEDFGASIVFERHRGRELEFAGRHAGPDGEFRSPDERNVGNLRHFRLARLRAADVVGDPAANPGGLFSALEVGGNALPAAAERLLEVVFAGRDGGEVENVFGVHPERARAFVAGFLERHGLRVVAAESKQEVVPMGEDHVSDEVEGGQEPAAAGEQLGEPVAARLYSAEELGEMRDLATIAGADASVVLEFCGRGEGVAELRAELLRRAVAARGQRPAVQGVTQAAANEETNRVKAGKAGVDRDALTKRATELAAKSGRGFVTEYRELLAQAGG